MPAYAFATVRAPRATTTSTWWMPWRARWSSPASISLSVPGQRRSPSAFAGRRQPRSSGRTMKGRIGRGPFQGGGTAPEGRGRGPLDGGALVEEGRRSGSIISSFGIRNALNQAMDSRLRRNDVVSVRRATFTLAVIPAKACPRRSGGAGTRFGQRIPKLENHASCHDADAVIAFPRVAPRVQAPPRRGPGRS